MMANVDTEREELIFSQTLDWSDGSNVRDFTHLEVDRARELVEQGYAPAEQRQNRSPTNEELVNRAAEFVDEEGVIPSINGYIISPERDDACVSFVGVVLKPDAPKRTIPEEAEWLFARHFHSADVLTLDDEKLFAWWD